MRWFDGNILAKALKQFNTKIHFSISDTALHYKKIVYFFYDIQFCNEQIDKLMGFIVELEFHFLRKSVLVLQFFYFFWLHGFNKIIIQVTNTDLYIIMTAHNNSYFILFPCMLPCILTVYQFVCLSLGVRI